MADRKARLAALAARAGRFKKPDGVIKPPPSAAADVEGQVKSSGTSLDEGPKAKPEVHFRNYAPRDESLGDDGETTPARPSKRKRGRDPKGADGGRDSSTDAAPTERTPLERALLQAKLDARAAASRVAATGGGGNGAGEDVVAMAPKKVNWDLKRDIEAKIDRLERRTQRAIVDLLRERLEREASEGGGADDDEYDDLD